MTGVLGGHAKAAQVGVCCGRAAKQWSLYFHYLAAGEEIPDQAVQAGTSNEGI